MAATMVRPLTLALRRHEQAILLAAAACVIVAVSVAPLLQLFGGALESGSGELALLASPRMWALLGRSLVLSAGATCLALAIGIPLGLLFARGGVPGARTLWLVHALPMFLPPIIPALGWTHWLGREGLIGTEATARALYGPLGLLGVLGVGFAPIVTSLVALGVLGVDASLEEAARLVARPWRVATRILLPAAGPAIALAAILVFALAVSELGVPMLLRVDVYPAAVFARLGGVDSSPTEVFALALPLVPVALVLLVLERRYASRRSFAVLAGGGPTRGPLPLGRWRALGGAACVGGAALSAAPLASLWLRAAGRGGGAGEVLQWARLAPLHGLASAAVAATWITVVGLIAGHALARGVRGSNLVDAAALLAFLTPAAVLGVGLVGVWNRPDTQLVYATLAMLVVGNVARYTAVGVRVVACAVAQSPVHLEEAAAACGASAGRRLMRVVLPVHARGVALAWLLALVFCLRDVETSVLFYPPGREPLTVRIFTLEANGPPAVVAGLCLLHVLVTAAVVGMGILGIGRRAR